MFNPLTARIFTVFTGQCVTQKSMGRGAPRGTHLRIQDHKKVKFLGQDISSLAVKGLNRNMKIVKKVTRTCDYV